MTGKILNFVQICKLFIKTQTTNIWFWKRGLINTRRPRVRLHQTFSSSHLSRFYLNIYHHVFPTYLFLESVKWFLWCMILYPGILYPCILDTGILYLVILYPGILYPGILASSNYCFIKYGTINIERKSKNTCIML